MEKLFKSWQSFAFGLLIGIIGGGVVVWLEMKDANRNFLSQILYELNTLKLEKKIAEDEQQKEKIAQTKSEKPASKFQRPSKNDKNFTDKNIASDSAEVPRLSFDTLPAEPLAKSEDSLQKDSVISTQDIVVKKDRLLFSTILKIKVKDKPEILQNSQDSLIEEISGVHKDEEKKEFMVEFWKSPINYKGYKMSDKKIILFGIDEKFESLSFVQLERKIYMKSFDGVYQMETTYNFEPFKKITDKALLAKIEE